MTKNKLKSFAQGIISGIVVEYEEIIYVTSGTKMVIISETVPITENIISIKKE